MDGDTASDNTSIDDKIDDFCENPTRDALTEGLMSLLKPTVDQLDERIRATRICQIELKQRIESVSEELQMVNEALKSPFELDPYIKKLINAKNKITIVGYILQSTQDVLSKLQQMVEQNIAKKKANYEVTRSWIPMRIKYVEGEKKGEREEGQGQGQGQGESQGQGEGEGGADPPKEH